MAAPATTVHLTDALPRLPGPDAVEFVRRLIDRAGAVSVDARGVTLRGVTGRTVTWNELQRVELASRADDLLRFAVGISPLGRVPIVGSRVQDAVLHAAASLDLPPVEWLRDRAGWTVLRLIARDAVEFKRLPGLIVRLYPGVSRAIVEQAEARDVPVVRLGLDR